MTNRVRSHVDMDIYKRYTLSVGIIHYCYISSPGTFFSSPSPPLHCILTCDGLDDVLLQPFSTFSSRRWTLGPTRPSLWLQMASVAIVAVGVVCIVAIDGVCCLKSRRTFETSGASLKPAATLSMAGIYHWVGRDTAI